MSTTVVWFRQDLRLSDNPALTAAVRGRDRVVPVYIWAPHEEGNWPPGAASRWWLHHSLVSLDRELRRRGSRLIVRSGDSLAILSELIDATGAARVVWNRRYEPAAVQRDAYVQAELNARGTRVEVFNGSLLFDVGSLRNRSGGPFQVFSPFWDACLSLETPARPKPAPRSLPAPKRWPQSLELSALELLPRIDWASGIAATWTPGEQAGTRTLQGFIRKSLSRYHEDRDRPDLPGTSRLSPYLHWGEIGPRRVWHAVHDALSRPSGRAARQGASVFLRELGWREFAHHLLACFPRTPEEPLRDKFAAIPWIHDDRALRAWQKGRTGYPLVDAGMRQVWQTGWMHNRVRMVVASFLVKHLLISWQTGSKWFWDVLVDADLANNTLGWQWTAGCGADAAPYFRVFNPVSQGEKCDPRGLYIAAFAPELRDRPPELIHKPRGAERSLFDNAESLGSYPPPIVEHAVARERFLSMAAALKS